MYLENNLNKIKNNFSDIYDKYQRSFKYTANKEKNNIDYKLLSSKTDNFNFYDRYNTLYNYLNYFSKLSVREIFKGENNIEKAYNDLVFNNKKIDDVHYKKVNNELNDSSKNIFQEAKKLFDLRVEIYRKVVLEEENLKFEKSVGETVKLKNQKDNLSETPEQKEYIEYIENKSKTINYNMFKEYFNFELPTVLTKQLYEI